MDLDLTTVESFIAVTAQRTLGDQRGGRNAPVLSAASAMLV